MVEGKGEKGKQIGGKIWDKEKQRKEEKMDANEKREEGKTIKTNVYDSTCIMNVAASKLSLSMHNMAASEASPCVHAMAGPPQELECRTRSALKF